MQNWDFLYILYKKGMIYMFQIIKEDNEEEWVLKLALQGG